MTKADGSVVIDTRIDTKGLNKGFSSVKSQFGNMASAIGKIGGAVAAAFSVKAIVDFGTESSKAAMQLSDAFTGLQSILNGQGRSFSDAQAFIEEYTKDGLIPATNAITAFKNLASRGYDDSQIKSVMTALKDAAAFGRQAGYSMGDAVQGATEGLKNENSVLVDNAGITKNVAKMWDDYAASIGTTANNLTQAQKIQAEVAGILEESKFQIGDAAKVSGTLSGQLQQLSFGFNNLKVAVGNIVNPIVQAFLPAVNAAVTAVTRLANSIAATVGAFFGKAAVQTEAIAEAAASGAEAEEALASGIASAGKAAKKSLAGFDQLTKLQDPNTASGGGASGTTLKTTVKTTVDNNTAVSSVSEGFKKLKDMFEQGDFYGIGEAFANFMQDTIRNINWSRIAEMVSEAFSDIVVFALGIASELDPTVATEIAANMWSGIIGGISNAVQKADWSKIGGDILDMIKKGFVRSNPAAWFVKTMLSPSGQSLVSSISEFLGSLIGGLISAISGFGTEIGKAASGIWGWIKGWFDKDSNTNWGNTPGKITGGLFSGIQDSLRSVGFWIRENVWIPFRDAFADAFGINGKTSEEMTWFGSVIMDSLKLAIENKMELVRQALKNVWDKITGFFSREKASTAFFQDVKENISNAFTDLVNKLINGINTIIRTPFNKLNTTLNKIRSISILGMKPFEGLWSYNPISVPQIPYLAKGAVIPPNAPFMAVLGDQRHGTNIEAPLSTIQEAVSQVMADYQASSLAGQEAVVQRLERLIATVEGIEVGDTVIGEAAQRYSRRQSVVFGGNA